MSSWSATSALSSVLLPAWQVLQLYFSAHPQSSKDRYGAPGMVPTNDSPVGSIPVAPPLLEEE